VLDEHGIRWSMGRKGNCWDNAPNGDGPFDIRQAARTALFQAIEGWRNHQRLHSRLGSITPANKKQIAVAA
jgi:transposase InsO family protein